LSVHEGQGIQPMREAASASPRRAAWPRRWWINALLLFATIVSTSVFGFAVVESFSRRQPFDVDRLIEAWSRFGRRDLAVWTGLEFSVPLLVILLAHEFGHYVVCARRGVKASLPYFLPSPMLFGTFGAFIRIRSPIYSRKSLFDIGIAGPIAGFVTLLPFLIAGVCMSRVVSGVAIHSSFVFGTPLALRLAEWLRFPHVSPADISLHPMAMAAWVGLLATAFNLLPMGQLDGGHILYAVFGQVGHRLISRAMLAVLAVLGFLYWPWWIWGAVMFFLMRWHPLIYDRTPISRLRVLLSTIALVIFLASISVVPVRPN
jgi:membrane-associated protease RseP (regulator of RpoE activity)